MQLDQKVLQALDRLKPSMPSLSAREAHVFQQVMLCGNAERAGEIIFSLPLGSQRKVGRSLVLLTACLLGAGSPNVEYLRTMKKVGELLTAYTQAELN